MTPPSGRILCPTEYTQKRGRKIKNKVIRSIMHAFDRRGGRKHVLQNTRHEGSTIKLNFNMHNAASYMRFVSGFLIIYSVSLYVRLCERERLQQDNAAVSKRLGFGVFLTFFCVCYRICCIVYIHFVFATTQRELSTLPFYRSR